MHSGKYWQFLAQYKNQILYKFWDEKVNFAAIFGTFFKFWRCQIFHAFFVPFFCRFCYESKSRYFAHCVVNQNVLLFQISMMRRRRRRRKSVKCIWNLDQKEQAMMASYRYIHNTVAQWEILTIFAS